MRVRLVAPVAHAFILAIDVPTRPIVRLFHLSAVSRSLKVRAALVLSVGALNKESVMMPILVSTMGNLIDLCGELS